MFVIRIRQYLRMIGLAVGLAVFAVNISAQIPAEAQDLLRGLYERGDFNAKSFQAAWLQDSTGYTLLEAEPEKKGRALVLYDAVCGKRTVLASASRFVPSGSTEPLGIDRYVLSTDNSWMLMQVNLGGARNRVSEFWRLGLSSGRLQRLAKGQFISISPSSGHILFSNKGNLHVYDLSNDKTISLTEDGVAGSVSYGRGVWSPDGQRIVCVRSDSSDVRLRPMLLPNDPSYPEVREVRFARVGETIPKLSVGVIEVQGGKTRWLSLSVPDEGFYLGPVSWAGNSHELLVEKRSRGRDEREFLIVDINAGTTSRIFHESDPAWVIASYRRNAGLDWFRDGRSFIVLSEKDGWRHAYVYSRDGAEQDILTPGASEIIERGLMDETGGWFYYFASPNNATQRYLYRVGLDGTKEPEQVTPASQPGTHTYDFSPDASWAFHTYSTFDTPPVTELVHLPDHRVARVLEDNSSLCKKVTSLTSRPVEFLQLEIGDSVELDAYLIKSRDFDPSQKYPVFVYVYSEPHSQTVVDRWSGTNIYHRLIADLGYLVVSMDSRGTPAPKGAAWRRAVFGSLGPLSTKEQAAGLKVLGRTRPYVDLSRVGIWGWSGGGSNTLNAMFRQPDVYHVGIAVAPKPQPHLYNAWFQEIYMRTREENPEGYKRSAPINFAEGLKGDLLIIHGTGETNTHLEITEGLVDRLIELGKSFDYMTYPNRDHGIRRGQGTSLHLRKLMVRYLLDHLPPGGR